MTSSRLLSPPIDHLNLIGVVRFGLGLLILNGEVVDRPNIYIYFFLLGVITPFSTATYIQDMIKHFSPKDVRELS